MFQLQGKKVVLTGASGGLGEGIASAFIAQGATVALSGTRQDVLEQLAQKLGEKALLLPCNLKNWEETEKLVSQAEELMGQVDILINNAGITRDGLLIRMKDDDFHEVLAVNLEAPFRLMRAVMRGMIKRRWGRIINITSIVGITGNPGQANYAAAKAGIIGLSKSVAAEVASRHITVNCIAPGFMISPMTEQLSESQKATLLSTIPMGRMGTTNDIAAACVFLASEEASYITGQTLHINGGMAMI
jgi:3-oxoacyl-[acyl-carrier protein] reductase